jgi:phage/plasmid-associated DNA primase
VGKATLNLIKTNLRVNENVFNDAKIGEIHFKDGYIDLKTLTFKARTKSHYMTFCICRDFKPKDGTEKKYTEAKKKLTKIIKEIYPDENDKNCVLESFSEAIIGISSRSQYNLFLLGMGSSGKSTLMKIIKNAFGDMIFQFKDDTFSKNNNKSDRVLNMLMLNPFIRIMWVNELKGKIDDSLFKQICEGEIQTTSLFKEGMNTVKFNALLVSTMNEFPNIKIDSGVERRIRSLEHKSKFTENKKELDDKNIYITQILI